MEDKSKKNTKKEDTKIVGKTGEEKCNININIKIFDEEKESEKIIEQFKDISKEVSSIEPSEESEEKHEKDKKSLIPPLKKTNIYGSITTVNERSLRDFSPVSSGSSISNLGIISSLEGNSFKQKRNKSEGNRILNSYSQSKF